MLEQLIALSTILFAISLATERLVTIIKTAFPKLGIENKDNAGEVDLEKDRPRRLLVQVISFLSGWVTASLLTPDSNLFTGHIKINDEISFHVAIVGFLSMGGSAFWGSLLGYAKAVKDIRTQERILNEKQIKSLQNGIR